MFGAPVFLTLLVLSCGYALWRGNRDARVVAAACCLATLATHLAIAPLRERYSSVEEGVLLVDGLTLLVFVLVALRSDRFWPLWVAGLQLTAATGHLLKGVHFELLPQAYGAALHFWSYPILLILAVGTFRNQQRLARQRTFQQPA
jgi:hypothetical protein